MTLLAWSMRNCPLSVVRLLHDDDFIVRRNATYAIGAFKTNAAVALKELARLEIDLNEEVRIAGGCATDMIKGAAGRRQ
jgi:HEAT repeat protein